MADFETKLRWLSERGNPVGAKKLIERIEADLAGDPLVVVGKPQKGVTMARTQPPATAGGPRRNSGPAWALATSVVALAVGGALYLALNGGDGGVAEQTTLPTTLATTVPTTTTVTTAAVAPIVLTQEDYEPIRPGTYFIDRDGDPTTTAGFAVTIATGGWIGSKDGVNFNGDSVSLHLHLFQEPFTPGCGQTEGSPLPSGSTATDLADGFAASGFVVREAPAPVSAFGQDGYRVVIEVPAGCEFGGDPGFTHYTGPLAHLAVSTGDVIEVWAFDMDGDIVMVEALWNQGYPTVEVDLAEMRAVIDSLVLLP